MNGALVPSHSQAVKIYWPEWVELSMQASSGGACPPGKSSAERGMTHRVCLLAASYWLYVYGPLRMKTEEVVQNKIKPHLSEIVNCRFEKHASTATNHTHHLPAYILNFTLISECITLIQT